ncbi:MAG: hypothetical protein IRZ18_04135 [Clostridia bacterium]|nr:hypothetical protein [Clostridia bacterium]
MNVWIALALLFVSVVAVLATPFFVPATITDASQLGHLRFGAPWPFVEQASSLTPPDSAYPMKTTLLSPLENPTRFLLFPFALDVSGVWVGLLALVWAWRRRTR